MGALLAGLAWFTQVSVDGSYVTDLFPGFLLVGVGLGFSFVPVSIAALGGVTGKEAGLASGLINTSQQIGGALGLAILSTVSTTRTENLIEDGTAAARAHRGVPARLLGGGRLRHRGHRLTLLLIRRSDLAPEGEGGPAHAPAGM